LLPSQAESVCNEVNHVERDLTAISSISLSGSIRESVAVPAPRAEEERWMSEQINKQAVRGMAYYIWEREGRPDGQEEDHWHRVTIEWIGQERGQMLSWTMKKKLWQDVPTRTFPRC
jgi:Protein of unknown function (DUF2934)